MPGRPSRRTRLTVELLEARDVPTTWPADGFDTQVVGAPPSGWEIWGADGSARVRVNDQRAVAGRSLASDGGSPQAARAWFPQSVPADATVTASVFADSLIPGLVLTRGSKLSTSTPSYYAASVIRGLDVKLLRVVDGTTTELAAIRTSTYLSAVWVEVSLTTQGDRQQVRVRRRDTGEWLNPFGSWQAGPAVALDARDGALRTAGHAGLGRAASYAGTLHFDEVSVAPAAVDLVPPVVTARAQPLSPAVRPGTVAGFVRLSATVREAGRLERVEVFVDSALVGRFTARPLGLNFDTRNVSNGTHEVLVRAWDAAGNVGEDRFDLVVFNRPTTDRPAIPRHHGHVRYAALAYNGTKFGPDEERLLRERVDLVIPNARYLARIHAAAPGTPQLVYSNISNLYLDLLTDWLAYADRTGVPREAAFYHVAEPTPFVGDSPSSQPVTWFWNVQRGPAQGTQGYAKLTGESRTGGFGDVALGGSSQAVYLGYPERFREVNVELYQAPAVGWTGVWEYPSRVDASGRPTAWKVLRVLKDGTAGVQRSGQLAFDPPHDWVPAVVPGSDARLHYVRIRTGSGKTAEAPIVSRLLGRDYVGARGARAGTIPAFDDAADANRDGYLTDAEYARRRAGLDARFVYESRLFYPFYGQMRFVTNPSGQGVGAWAAGYHRRLLAAHPQADGVFMDNSGGRAPVEKAVLLESTDTYASDYGAVLGTINRTIAPQWVLANTSGGGADADRVVRQVPATIEEFALRPLAHTWVQFRDTAEIVARRLGLSDPPGYLILDTLSTGGSATDERTRVSALAYYYLLADPDATLLMTWGGEEPASAWSRHWFDAIASDVGRPRGEWSEWQAGADPADPALTYRVFQRAYVNALVLYKPLSYATGKGTGTRADNTATTHALNGNYRPLRSDGTLGPVTTAISLRNGEGAILVRA